MTLAAEYFISCFIAASAVIQLAAVKGELRGLLFNQAANMNTVLILVSLLIPGIFFFTWNARNPVGIIEGAQQAGLFSLAVITAGFFTLLVSSLLNHSRFTPPPGVPADSLESLKNMTFFQAIRRRYWKA